MNPDIRLNLFFAAERETCVILLRAKSRLFRLIQWDLKTNAFQDGQWIKRNVVPETCDLSPDGTHFLYYVFDGRMQQPAGEEYTVVSRVPYFAALAVYPTSSFEPAGGYFLGDDIYRINGDENACDIIQRPFGLKQVVRGKVNKNCRSGFRFLDGKPAPVSYAIRHELLDGPAKPNLRLQGQYPTSEGCLYRKAADGSNELIRDFRDMEFEDVIAPYGEDRPKLATRRTPWHPLDGEIP